jgi:hypothetical protein
VGLQITKAVVDAGRHDSLEAHLWASSLKFATVQQPTPKAGEVQIDKFSEFPKQFLTKEQNGNISIRSRS